MRRLSVLPCPEAWERMRDDGDGRYCERCRLRVTEVARLDRDGVEQLLAAAASDRVCARFELDGGRPKTTLGLAAGLVVVALAGCATPVADSHAPVPVAIAEPLELAAGREGSGAAISGQISDPDGLPAVGAIVLLQSAALPGGVERLTDARGIYRFDDLPPGNYTIQALYGKADASKS